MGIIIRLEEHLANMIAAGEVIERPANVVKELVENALDAGASSVDIELREGGLSGIAVTDDGRGMDFEDALLAFERHATSKIKTEPDLFRIRSLGFRGEALPSMAAVARVELETSQGGSSGTKVVFQAGKKISAGTGPARKGTRVSVTKLFYNTPARLKYLKGPVPELAVITDMVDKFALAHPDVGFSLSHEGKEILRTPGNGKVLEVLGRIYGFGVARMMKPFRREDREYRLSGVIANPLVNRSAKSYMTLIANGRVIKNPKIAAAVVEAYGQLIPKGRYPVALLEIACDPLLLDVNIHPTKAEIKFSEEAKLLNLIRDTLQDVLRSFQVVQEAPAAKPPVFGEEPGDLGFAPLNPERPLALAEAEPALPEEAEEPLPPAPAIPEKRLPELEYIGQYAGTYLLFQNAEGLYLLDQHAAAERIRYERYRRKMGEPDPGFYDLLVPFNLDFALHEAPEIQELLPVLKTFGIVLSPSGTTSFFLRSVPAWFPAGEEEANAETVVRTALEGKDLRAAEVRDELAKLLACKRSIKANRYINAGEVFALLADLRACENPYTCPHGRPVLVKIGLRDVEKWFKRVAG